MEEELKDRENGEEESKSAISADLIRGHINTIILRTLYESMTVLEYSHSAWFFSVISLPLSVSV